VAIMRFEDIVLPKICNLLRFIETEKYKILNPICDFSHNLYNQIDWIDGDDGKIVADKIIEIRDDLPRMVEEEIKHLEIKIINLPKSREQIGRFLYEKLDLGPTDQYVFPSENSADSE
jgi:hypothetical protein